MKGFSYKCLNCVKDFSGKEILFRCPNCGGPVEINYELPNREKISFEGSTIIERFKDFFPFEKQRKEFSMGEGNTPLLKSESFGKKIGCGNLCFKMESQNPTWSFKDRGTYLCLCHAIESGFRRIGTVSTGNMAVSVAAYAKRAGIDADILLKSSISEEKIAPVAFFNPNLILVECDYSELYYKSIEAGIDLGIYFMNSDVPFRVEGSKTISYEIFLQLNRRVPDFVIVPVSAGGNIRGIEKGFRELFMIGLTKKIPRFVCVQAQGCSPITKAFSEGKDKIENFLNPDTVAHAIENPFPPSGNAVLKMLKDRDGLAVAVSDEEILKTWNDLACEGIFCQPASAVGPAALKTLIEAGEITSEDTSVCIVTGSGLKTPSVLKRLEIKTKKTDLNHLKEIM